MRVFKHRLQTVLNTSMLEYAQYVGHHGDQTKGNSVFVQISDTQYIGHHGDQSNKGKLSISANYRLTIPTPKGMNRFNHLIVIGLVLSALRQANTCRQAMPCPQNGNAKPQLSTYKDGCPDVFDKILENTPDVCAILFDGKNCQGEIVSVNFGYTKLPRGKQDVAKSMILRPGKK